MIKKAKDMINKTLTKIVSAMSGNVLTGLGFWWWITR